MSSRFPEPRCQSPARGCQLRIEPMEWTQSLFGQILRQGCIALRPSWPGQQMISHLGRADDSQAAMLSYAETFAAVLFETRIVLPIELLITDFK
jgi:hypothetical protein